MVILRPSLRRKVIGWCSMALGPLGGLIPILPGFLFFVLGVFILRDQYVWAHRGVGMVRSRWPQIIPAVEAREVRAMLWADRQVDRVKGWFGR